jgi:hypothetical protein
MEVSLHMMFPCECAVLNAENPVKIEMCNFDRMREQLPE